MDTKIYFVRVKRKNQLLLILRPDKKDSENKQQEKRLKVIFGCETLNWFVRWKIGMKKEKIIKSYIAHNNAHRKH